MKLVEEKRAGVTLAVLFNGGPIDPLDAIPSPVHTSFDVNNRLLARPMLNSGSKTPQAQAPAQNIPSSSSFFPHQSLAPISQEATVPSFIATPCPPPTKDKTTPSPAMAWKVSTEIVEGWINNQIKNVAISTLREVMCTDSIANHLITEFTRMHSLQVGPICMDFFFCFA